MPQEKLVAKYQGDGSEYFTGVPRRDLYESDWAGLTDEQKALLAAVPPSGVKPLYQLRHDAPAEAEKAAERVADTEAQAVAPAPAPEPTAPERRAHAPRRE